MTKFEKLVELDSLIPEKFKRFSLIETKNFASCYSIRLYEDIFKKIGLIKKENEEWKIGIEESDYDNEEAEIMLCHCAKKYLKSRYLQIAIIEFEGNVEIQLMRNMGTSCEKVFEKTFNDLVDCFNYVLKMLWN